VKRVVVMIAGQRLAIRTDADEAYIERLAGYVDTKVREAQQSTKTVASHGAAMLAALSIADDLFRERKEQTEFRRRVREKSERILATLEANLGAGELPSGLLGDDVAPAGSD
jgi:cell division protein ZapA